MLHVFYGPDTFSRAEAFAALKQRLDRDGMLATNTTTFDGRSVKPDELFAACDAVPFLAACRLVVVEGLLTAQDGRPRRARAARGAAKPDAASAGESPWSLLPAYVQRLPETTELVLLDGEVKDGNALLAELRGVGDITLFALLAPAALPGWIAARVKDAGGAIQPRAAAVLAETVGSNLWQLRNEIEKLVLYADARPIEVADVQAMVSVAQQATVFQFTDAVLAGQGAEAMRLARLLLDGGTAAQVLLTLLARQFRQLVLLRDLRRHGQPRAEMMRVLELRSDFVLGRLLAQAGRFPPGWLEHGYERLLRADLNIKRGIQDESTAIELLVAEVAGLR